MKMKKILALSLSAAMAMGIAMPVSAADPTVDAPIYSFETISVIVPTTYKVAFNPEGLTVKTGSTTSTDQILSKNYGILNKSNKDMVCTVELKVTDKNTGDEKVEFVNSADDVTNAKDGEYKIHLEAVPANTTEVKVGSTPASADKDTAAAAMDEVTMTGADAQAVTLKGGNNKIAFKLEKAEYQPKSGSELTLGDAGNDVSAKYEIKQLAADGKGITAFTFGGSMNANADWTKLQSGIEITSVYTSKVAGSDVTPITGTAMVQVGPSVSIDATGKISIMNLDGELYQSISINDGTQDWSLGDSDGTWEWEAAENGKKEFVLGDGWMDFVKGKTVTVTVTLTDDSTITSSSVQFPSN